MAIELITGLHPVAVRGLIDDNVFEELAGAIEQHHDGTAEEAEDLTGLHMPSSCKCAWPPALLSQMALIAAKCSRTQAKLRSTIGAVLPELERAVREHLGGDSGGAAVESSSCRLHTGL